MVYRIAVFVLNFVFWFFFKIKVSGEENIPQKGGFILASNHASYLDPAVLAIACPRKLDFMAKKELFNIPLLSNIISAAGAFAVRRNTADITALKEAMKRVNAGNGLLLFPEGSRKEGSADLEPQAGIGFLAAKINALVIPVFISGTDKALPKGAKFIKAAKVSVTFGKQISIEKGMPYKEIAQNIMDNIRRLS